MQDRTGKEPLLGDVAAGSDDDAARSGDAQLMTFLQMELFTGIEAVSPGAASSDEAGAGSVRGIGRLFSGRPGAGSPGACHGPEEHGAGGQDEPHEEMMARRWAPIVERMDQVWQEHGALLGLVDMACVGMFIFDPEAHLVFSNRFGERILATGDELKLGGGKLSATRADNVVRIGQLFTRMASAPLWTVGTTRIERSPASPYILMLTRCMLGRNEALVAFLSDIDQRAAVASEMLRELYGLGRAEAEIAGAMARGMDLEAIAEQRRTSVGTVRNQVKAIAAKMDCTRQSDIIRRVLSIPIMCHAPDGRRD